MASCRTSEKSAWASNCSTQNKLITITLYRLRLVSRATPVKDVCWESAGTSDSNSSEKPDCLRQRYNVASEIPGFLASEATETWLGKVPYELLTPCFPKHTATSLTLIAPTG